MGWSKSLRKIKPSRLDDTSLWVTSQGTRLGLQSLHLVLRRRSKDAGIEASSLHSFRRAFALSCLRSGMDIFALQRLMGHADISILRRYLAQTHEDLLRAHMQHSPVESMLAAVRDPLSKGSGIG
ncbi:MAG: tyrosine-type recombinase/integrase [Anaerolineae bacterium]